MDEAQGRPWGSGTSAGRLTLETLKEADEAWVGWFGCRLVRVQAPALRRELQRSEGGVAHEPARLHSCSKFTTPGSYLVTFLNSTLYVCDDIPLCSRICNRV